MAFGPNGTSASHKYGVVGEGGDSYPLSMSVFTLKKISWSFVGEPAIWLINGWWFTNVWNKKICIDLRSMPTFSRILWHSQMYILSNLSPVLFFSIHFFCIDNIDVHIICFLAFGLLSITTLYFWILLFAATDPASSTSRGHSTQVAPGVVIETFSLPVQGDGVPPEINRVSLQLQEDWGTFMVLLVQLFLMVIVSLLLSLFLSRLSLLFWVLLEFQTL